MILQQLRMTEMVKSLVKRRESAETRRGPWVFTNYILLLATEWLNCERELFFTKLVCDYAVAIVVVCKDIPTLSLVAYISRCWT